MITRLPIELSLGEFDTISSIKKLNPKPEDLFKHIHGELHFRIDGRDVPYLGYWGPNDVCFNTWLPLLIELIKVMRAGEKRYEFDEMEQGQPAYVFEKSGYLILLSIVESKSGTSYGDENWQNIPFKLADLETAVSRLIAEFLAILQKKAPHQMDYWSKLLS